jgi:hypothetical protein
MLWCPLPLRQRHCRRRKRGGRAMRPRPRSANSDLATNATRGGRLVPPPPRGGRTERHGFSAPSRACSTGSASALSPMAFLVGVTLPTRLSRLLQRRPNGIEHTRQVAIDVGSRHAHNAIAFGDEPTVPARVRGDVVVRGMLAPVNFDDQMCVETHEIDDEVPERMLPANARPIEATRPQPAPQYALGAAHGLAKTAGARVWHRGTLPHTCSPGHPHPARRMSWRRASQLLVSRSAFAAPTHGAPPSPLVRDGGYAAVAGGGANGGAHRIHDERVAGGGKSVMRRSPGSPAQAGRGRV